MNFISYGVEQLILPLRVVKMFFKVQQENHGALSAAVKRDGNRRCETSQRGVRGTQQVRGYRRHTTSEVGRQCSSAHRFLLPISLVKIIVTGLFS